MAISDERYNEHTESFFRAVKEEVHRLAKDPYRFDMADVREIFRRYYPNDVMLIETHVIETAARVERAVQETRTEEALKRLQLQLQNTNLRVNLDTIVRAWRKGTLAAIGKAIEAASTICSWSNFARPQEVPLKAWIDRSGRSSNKIALDLGVSPPYLRRLCNEERFPSEAFALRIEEYTDGEVTAKSFRDRAGRDLRQERTDVARKNYGNTDRRAR